MAHCQTFYGMHTREATAIALCVCVGAPLQIIVLLCCKMVKRLPSA